MFKKKCHLNVFNTCCKYIHHVCSMFYVDVNQYFDRFKVQKVFPGIRSHRLHPLEIIG